jgi:putative inorganic carbon (hco3(-)) transporter
MRPMSHCVGDLLQTDSRTENALDSPARPVRDMILRSIPALGRGSQLGALAAAVGLVVLGALGGREAAGLALLAVVAVVTALLRPYLLGPLVVLLLPAGESVHVLGAQVSPLEAVIGGGAIGYVARVATRREELRMGPADYVFAALVAFIAVSTLGPVDDSDRLREVLFWGALGVVFHVVLTHLGTQLTRRLLFVGVAVAALFEASLALYQYADHWSERRFTTNGIFVYPVPTGTLEHRNALGQFLVLTALAVLALALAQRGALRRVGFVAAGVSVLALIVTFSRGSWIAFVIGVAVYLIDRRTRVSVLTIGAAAAVCGVALAFLDGGAIGARISSLFHFHSEGLYEFRLELVKRGARIAAEHPLTGSGHFQEAGTYAGSPDLATHPHNLFVGLAVFFGIPAALAFAGLVFLALRGAWRGYRVRTDALGLTALGFVAVLVAFLVNGLFEYPFWNTSLSALVVVVLAVALSLDRLQPHASLPAPGPWSRLRELWDGRRAR